MKNRRILTVVLAVIMAFGLVACGGGNKPAETEPKEEEAEGYEECTIAEYSGIMKQTSFYGYVSSYLLRVPIMMCMRPPMWMTVY